MPHAKRTPFSASTPSPPRPSVARHDGPARRFILGPALGGFLAARFLSAPMFFSALASSGAALLCLHVLPEPRSDRRWREDGMETGGGKPLIFRSEIE